MRLAGVTQHPTGAWTTQAARVRRRVPQRRRDGHPHSSLHRSPMPTPNAGSGRYAASCWTAPHLEPPPPRAVTAARIRRARQHAPTAPQSWTTPTRQPRRCRLPARPADPTTPHLQRTHQPVPPSSLNPTPASPTLATSGLDTAAPRIQIRCQPPLRPENAHAAPRRVSGTHRV